ncbi:hypothetical protein B0H19DRAFT_106039 [Mycena capillaripes]|nr:hypothetical protein B0H19DRAFT_106039 [Mycena capillaripes]
MWTLQTPVPTLRSTFLEDLVICAALFFRGVLCSQFVYYTRQQARLCVVKTLRGGTRAFNDAENDTSLSYAAADLWQRNWLFQVSLMAAAVIAFYVHFFFVIVFIALLGAHRPDALVDREHDAPEVVRHLRDVDAQFARGYPGGNRKRPRDAHAQPRGGWGDVTIWHRHGSGSALRLGGDNGVSEH